MNVFGSIIRRYILWPFSRIKHSDSLGSNTTKNQKLVMTLLVKNEVDVIRPNIDFHLSQGVDFIIATDNMSNDGTYEILQEYESRGVLHLIRERSHTYDQAKWVNRMGQLAVDRFDARLVFHCDGDEFWTPQAGNLKTELCRYPLVDVLNVKFINVMLEDQNGKETFPRDTKYAVSNPLPDAGKLKSVNNSQFLYQPQPKVICRVLKQYIPVNMGNHDVRNKRRFIHRKANSIVIYHFPVRSKNQFFQKVIIGGSALANNKEIPHNQGSHLRKWYAAYQQGLLDAEYKKLILNIEQAKYWIDKGTIEIKSDFFR